MIIRHNRLFAAVTAIVALTFLTGCTEKLENSVACPLLCPEQSQPVSTIDLDGVAIDTTILGSLGAGTEPILLLATRGPAADSLDTRVVVRFDTIPTRYRPTTTDTTTQPITFVDSAFVRFHLQLTNYKATAPVTIQVYDVDTTASDTATAAVLPLFRAGQLVTSQTYTVTELADTSALRVNLPSAFVLGKVSAGKRIRLGFRATSSAPVQLRIFSFEASSTLGPQLSFEYTSDQTITPFTSPAYSKGPVDQIAIAQDLGDYMLVVRGSPAAVATDIAVGGVPGRRSYFKFNIPSSIIDSSVVVRATLILTQFPNRTIDPGDTIVIYPRLVVAGSAITDITRAAQITSAIVALDSLKTVPRDSGDKLIELAPAFAAWKIQTEAQLPRAIVLQSSTEGNTPLQARFFSHEATNTALRPRLRISYTRRTGTGLP